MTNSDKWIPLKNGKYISAERMSKTYTDFTQAEYSGGFVWPEESAFILSDASRIGNNGETFGLNWKEHGIEINHNDPAIDKCVKAVIVLGRESGETVNIPTNKEYIDMMIEVAQAKARGEEPLASFYETLVGLPTDLTRDIVEFQGNIKSGPNKGKYAATLLRFNDKGILEPIDDVVIAQEGEIREIDKYGLPTRTTEEFGPIENIDTDTLSETESSGRLYIFRRLGVSPPPEKNEQRMIMRVPDAKVGFFRTYITQSRDFDEPNHFGTLRMKREG
jgi:hypothetical protein